MTTKCNDILDGILEQTEDINGNLRNLNKVWTLVKKNKTNKYTF